MTKLYPINPPSAVKYEQDISPIEQKNNFNQPAEGLDFCEDSTMHQNKEIVPNQIQGNQTHKNQQEDKDLK